MVLGLGGRLVFGVAPLFVDWPGLIVGDAYCSQELAARTMIL